VPLLSQTAVHRGIDRSYSQRDAAAQVRPWGMKRRDDRAIRAVVEEGRLVC
jgi:hypothetical protein